MVCEEHCLGGGMEWQSRDSAKTGLEMTKGDQLSVYVFIFKTIETY